MDLPNKDDIKSLIDLWLEFNDSLPLSIDAKASMNAKLAFFMAFIAYWKFSNKPDKPKSKETLC